MASKLTKWINSKLKAKGKLSAAYWADKVKW